MGSTSIIGMMGKPAPDFSVVTEGLLPNIPDSIINKMAEKGWVFNGPAPHSFDKNADQWFFCTLSPEESKANGGISNYSCHVISFKEA